MSASSTVKCKACGSVAHASLPNENGTLQAFLDDWDDFHDRWCPGEPIETLLTVTT